MGSSSHSSCRGHQEAGAVLGQQGRLLDGALDDLVLPLGDRRADVEFDRVPVVGGQRVARRGSPKACGLFSDVRAPMSWTDVPDRVAVDPDLRLGAVGETTAAHRVARWRTPARRPSWWSSPRLRGPAGRAACSRRACRSPASRRRTPCFRLAGASVSPGLQDVRHPLQVGVVPGECSGRRRCSACRQAGSARSGRSSPGGGPRGSRAGPAGTRRSPARARGRAPATTSAGRQGWSRPG